MKPEELDARRAASHPAVAFSLMAFAVFAGFIGWNAGRLAAIQTQIQQQDSLIAAGEAQKRSLTEEPRTLTIDPSGGIRADARPVRAEATLYDFSIWIEVSSFPPGIQEVIYEFGEECYPAARPTVEAHGFAT